MTSNDKILYIGLNGLAGSGKDTVAKMLNVILMKDWESIEECKSFYDSFYDVPNASASYYEKYKDPKSSTVMCLAFADQLKNICASIFGIPMRCFYFNKSTAWICINKGFEYTETRPDNIISCEDYYYNLSEYLESDKPCWMSLRDILVYVGTYVLQQEVNKQVFVNTIHNQIRNAWLKNHNLKYVILTDVRFSHELEYIKDHYGITIKIVRDSIKQLPNIAEHDLDDEDSYTFKIMNNGEYSDLFAYVWDLVHENIEFKNNTVEMGTRDFVNNYLREIGQSEWRVCSPYRIQQIGHDVDGSISMIDLRGGPTIEVGVPIEGTEITPSEIEIDDITSSFIVRE